MNLKLPVVITKSLGRGTLYVKKYSPEILTTIGVVGVVTAAVMGAKATLKLEPIVDHVSEHKALAKQRLEDERLSQNDYVKEISTIYTRGTLDVIKLYGPSVTMGLSSIACILAAHGIMRRRNVALVAAYKAVENSFSAYRQRVIEELGEEQESDIYRGVREIEVKNSETGKTEIKHHIDPNGVSQYARFFDETCSQWSKTPEYNLLFVRCQQNYANDLLQSRGHVFLNEVYDMLGVERSQAGAVVGWVLNGKGDNFVDFGIYDLENQKAREFVNGQERSILLDFNVNGVIYDQI